MGGPSARPNLIGELNAQQQNGEGLGSTRQVQVNVGASVSDFTLRQNPSADILPTQANDELNLESRRAGGGLRASMDGLNMLTEDNNEVIEEIEENEQDADPTAAVGDARLGASPATEIMPATFVNLSTTEARIAA